MFDLEKDLKEQCDIRNSEIGELNKVDGINCTHCLNKGFVASIINQYVVINDCTCKKERTMFHAIKKSGLGQRFKDNSFETYVIHDKDDKRVKDSVENYMKSENKSWLVLSGQVGSGKTHLAIAVSRWFMEQGKNVKYFAFAKDFERLKKNMLSGFTDTQEKAQRDFAELCEVDVLLIDDFLKNNRDADATFDLIDYRYANNKITIITTEYNYLDMFSKSEAVTSRIKEMCGSYWIDNPKNIARNRRLSK